MVCCLIAEVNRDHKRRAKPYTPEDFMPKPRKVMGPKTMSNAVKSIAQMLGGETK